MTVSAPTTKPTFLYDDCCPLCRGYTATFTTLGWAERAPFSGIDDTTLTALDMDRARHHIPLHDAATGETRYGLDGILEIVANEAPLLAPIVKHKTVRAGLDRLYWFITYNRRHIVTAAPPAAGIDCAPDYEPAPVATYVAFCVAAATALAATSGAPMAVMGVAGAASTAAASRDPSHNINRLQAAGHAGSTTVAAAAVGAAARLLTGRADITTAAITITAARKLFLRRWMHTPR